MPLSTEERALRAQIAAHAKHAKHDPAEHMARMRAALWQKYYQQVDPSGGLPKEERQRRAQQAMRADLSRRALQAARARRDRAEMQVVDELLEVG